MPAAARADQAVVVGVDNYTNLAAEDSLHGCVNDAQAMADKLKSFGFDVKLLTNDQATRQGILDAIAAARNDSGGNHRFAFYFAGHGTQLTDGKAAILPSDTLDGAETNDITADDLKTAVQEVGAANTSVILDSCFSGGMTRSLKGLGRRTLRSRYYHHHLHARGTKDLVVAVDNQDDMHALNTNQTSGSNICYFAAARDNEEALEDDINGKPDGVFTYYLTSQLSSANDTWGHLQERVSAPVLDYSDDRQHPTLSPSCVTRGLFGQDEPAPAPTPAVTPANVTPPTPVTPPPPVAPAIVTPPAPTPAHTLWDDFNGDHADSSQVDVILTPNRNPIKVGEHCTLKITAPNGGYLAVLEYGTSGKIYLRYPATRDVEAAHVTSDNPTVQLPAAGSYFWADRAGIERLKAILFTSADAAQTLLSHFPDGNVSDSRELKRVFSKVATRDFVVASDNDAPAPAPAPSSPSFYTSDIIFEVVEAGK